MRNIDVFNLKTFCCSQTVPIQSVLCQTGTNIFYISSSKLFCFTFQTSSSNLVCNTEFVEPIQIKYLTFENKICIVEPILITVIPWEANSINLPLHRIKINDRIACVDWNYNEECLLLVYENGQIDLSSLDCGNGQIITLGSTECTVSVPQTVYVGWGSADTQFRGSVGKRSMQGPKNDEASNVLENNSKSTLPRASWRTNGEMVAINYSINSKRQVVICETEPSFRAVYRSQNVAEGILESLVAWRPLGNMIATLVRSYTGYEILMLEKNGLIRFSISLHIHRNTTVKDIKWSPCGQILSVITTNSISLFTSSNYEWHQKQLLVFDCVVMDAIWLETDCPQFLYQLQVMTPNRTHKYVFRNILNRNLNGAVCTRISANSLMVTDYDEAIIPPPLCTRELSYSCLQFNMVVVYSKNLIAALTEKNTLLVFSMNSVELEFSLNDICTDHAPIVWQNFLWLSESEIQFSNIAENREFILDWKRKAIIVRRDKITTCDNDTALYSHAEFYLNKYGHLCECSNGKKLFEEITSFVMYDTKYLLMTNRSNQLLCSRLPVAVPSNELFHRNIEQGALLVCATVDGHVVLQMPRGNIETISCALIAIDALDQHLNANRWSEAVRIIRDDKLNPNLLIDLDSERFLAHVKDFLVAIPNDSDLTSLLMQLESSNVLATIYTACGRGTNDVWKEKLDRVLECLFECMASINFNYYATTMAVVSVHFFELSSCIPILATLYDNKSMTCINKTLAALQQFQVDWMQLYTNVLQSYNIELARCILQFEGSQMDPRIYEAQLCKYEMLSSEIERRFAINHDLRKPEMAVQYLMRFGNIADVRNYIQENVGSNKTRVVTKAYRSYPMSVSNMFREISILYAEDLHERGRYYESGLVLKRAECYTKCVEEFKLCLKWRQALDALNKEETSAEKMHDILQYLVNGLIDDKRFEEAVQVVKHMGNGVNERKMAFSILTQGHLFEEALEYVDNDLNKEHFDRALFEYCQALRLSLSEQMTQFRRHRDRLIIVRASNHLKSHFFQQDTVKNVLDVPFSDTGSTIHSHSTHMTSSTSRNRRKESRKRESIKEGNIYEDIGLVRILHLLIQQIMSRMVDIQRVCCLMLSETQHSFDDVQDIYSFSGSIRAQIESSIKLVWPDHFYWKNPSSDAVEISDNRNIELLDPQFRVAPALPPHWTSELFSDCK